MNGYTIQDLKIGQTATFSKVITEGDVYSFAGVTGDFNPAHLNEEFAKETPFGKRIAHGMLSAGLISAVIGTQLPGPGTIYLEQSLRFMAPVGIGDTVTTIVTIDSINQEKNRAVLITTCINQNSRELISGTALVMPPYQRPSIGF